MQAVKASQIIGASKIFGIDVNDMKRDKAIAFGVTDFVNPKHSGKPISQLILEATDGLGVDYCFECTGVASVINEATASTKMVRLPSLEICHLFPFSFIP